MTGFDSVQAAAPEDRRAVTDRAGLVIGHTGHFPGGPTDFFFFAKDHHAGTTSSQWPIGLSPALTA